MIAASLKAIFTAVTPSPLLAVCLVTIVIAQGTKIAIYYFRDQKISWPLILSTGGMPSSHAATVTSLTVGILLFEGPTTLFVISFVFAGVVIRDALGVRWLAGQQSIVINKILRELHKEGRMNVGYLKELLGHTPLQVYAGCALGVLVAALTYGVWAVW